MPIHQFYQYRFLLILGGILMIYSPVFSQEKKEKPKPEFTERWDPMPAVVEPGNPRKAPSDAIILFDGTNMDAWQRPNNTPPQWVIEGDAMVVKPKTGPIKTKQSFGDMQLHIEFRTPSEVIGKGQGRGNSGIFLMQKYELQVLDSYENETYPNGQAGSFYKQHIPLVNASKAPGEWQTYDIIFMAPTFNKDGQIRTPATATVLHNGVLIQNHVSLRGPTQFIGVPQYKEHPNKLPILLQDHGNPVAFRNIWVREL